MKWFDTLRTALQLAERVEAVESEVQDLRFEWTDINEKLLAREGRLAKRLSRELKQTLDEKPVAEQGDRAAEGKPADKKQLMLHFREQKGG